MFRSLQLQQVKTARNDGAQLLAIFRSPIGVSLSELLTFKNKPFFVLTFGTCFVPQVCWNWRPPSWPRRRSPGTCWTSFPAFRASKTRSGLCTTPKARSRSSSRSVSTRPWLARTWPPSRGSSRSSRSSTCTKKASRSSPTTFAPRYFYALKVIKKNTSSFLSCCVGAGFSKFKVK